MEQRLSQPHQKWKVNFHCRRILFRIIFVICKAFYTTFLHWTKCSTQPAAPISLVFHHSVYFVLKTRPAAQPTAWPTRCHAADPVGNITPRIPIHITTRCLSVNTLTKTYRHNQYRSSIHEALAAACQFFHTWQQCSGQLPPCCSLTLNDCQDWLKVAHFQLAAQRKPEIQVLIFTNEIDLHRVTPVVLA